MREKKAPAAPMRRTLRTCLRAAKETRLGEEKPTRRLLRRRVEKCVRPIAKDNPASTTRPLKGENMLSKMTLEEKHALRVEIVREMEVTNVVLPYPHESAVDLLLSNATEPADPGRTNRRIRMSQQQAQTLAEGLLRMLAEVQQLESRPDRSNPH